MHVKRDFNNGKMILITGCGRSGTEYISKVLRKSGIEIGHEMEIKHDGISSWPLASARDNIPWGPGFSDVKFKHIVHQVRHPLKVIQDNEFSHLKESRDFVTSVIGESRNILHYHMRYWYHWNVMAEKLANWTYRIEDIDKNILKFSKMIGRESEINKIKSSLYKIPKNTGTRKNIKVIKKIDGSGHGTLDSESDLIKVDYKYKESTWEILEKEDWRLAERIKMLASKYGYGVPL